MIDRRDIVLPLFLDIESKQRAIKITMESASNMKCKKSQK